MSVTHTNLNPPSQAYREATLSLVYRLSELTFGSLLAAYSLGFVGAIATHWAEMSQNGIPGKLLLSMQYASISITFAYVTTSFYLTYHAGILTMPQMPLHHLRIDFSLAIVQALFFGLSILQPLLFPILLGINLRLTGWRQTHEHKELAKVLYERICTEKRPDAEKFRIGFQKLLREGFPKLSAWAPAGQDILTGALKMIALGSAVALACLAVEFFPKTVPLPNPWQWDYRWVNKQILITVEIVVVTAIITRYCWRLLKKRADFVVAPIKKTADEKDASADAAADRDHGPKVEQDLNIDEQFHCLQTRLAELCTKSSQ